MNSLVVSSKPILIDFVLDESSIGMSPRRVSGFGRKLLVGAGTDEKDVPYA